jgi:glycosyltransferase involved in cell wall biosynthesis
MSPPPATRAEPLVSVVTPVYNGAAYLAECIESVLRQTYSNWEYVIVDNASTDRTAEIAAGYARRDGRIHVYRNDALLTSAQNHNAGLRRISSDSAYCKFVHADDWLFPECLSRMVEVAESSERIAIVSAYRLDGARVTLTGLPYGASPVAGRDVCRATIKTGLYVFGSPTSLLIRSSCIRAREPFYDESRYPKHFDTAACYAVLESSDLGFVHQVLTFTRRHSGADSSFAKRVNSYIVENLRMLRQYGPVYLEPAEYEACLARAVRRYYRFLGRSLLAWRDPEFRGYHRAALRELGVSWSSARLIGASVVEGPLVALTSLKGAAKGARAFWRGKVRPAPESP